MNNLYFKEIDNAYLIYDYTEKGWILLDDKHLRSAYRKYPKEFIREWQGEISLFLFLYKSDICSQYMENKKL